MEYNYCLFLVILVYYCLRFIDTIKGGMLRTNISLYYEFALGRLQSQETLNSEYDGKISATVTLGLALVTVAAVMINLSGTAPSKNLWLWSPLVLLTFSFAAIVVFSIKCRQLSDWHNGPLEERFAEYIDELDTDELHRWSAESYGKAIRCNQNTLSHKARWVSRATQGLYAEVFAFIAVGAICCWP